MVCAGSFAQFRGILLMRKIADKRHREGSKRTTPIRFPG